MEKPITLKQNPSNFQMNRVNYLNWSAIVASGSHPNLTKSLFPQRILDPVAITPDSIRMLASDVAEIRTESPTVLRR